MELPSNKKKQELKIEELTSEDFEKLPSGPLEQLLIGLPYSRLEKLAVDSIDSEIGENGKVTQIFDDEKFWRKKIEKEFVLPKDFDQWVKEWKEPNDLHFFRSFFTEDHGALDFNYHEIGWKVSELNAIENLAYNTLINIPESSIKRAQRKVKRLVELDQIRDNLLYQRILYEERERSDNDLLLIDVLFNFENVSKLSYQQAIDEYYPDVWTEELSFFFDNSNSFIEKAAEESEDSFTRRVQYYRDLAEARHHQLTSLLREGDILQAKNNYFYVSFEQGEPYLSPLILYGGFYYLPVEAYPRVEARKPRTIYELKTLVSPNLEILVNGFTRYEGNQLVSYSLPRILNEKQKSQNWLKQAEKEVIPSVYGSSLQAATERESGPESD